MKILCVIPSRIGSTRLPRKPLLPIQGKPMIQWVYENAKKCPVISEVVVATDSEEIAQVIRGIGGQVELTSSDIPTGSDRVAIVAKKYPHMDIIINLQGDEPFIKPHMLKQLVAPYLNGEMPEMTTLAYPLKIDSDHASPKIVKVIINSQNDAIYFSRAPIPYFRQKIEVPVYHHIGVYAFRRDFMFHYTELTQTPLEIAEALEQLRVLENGYKIRVCLTDEGTLEINDLDEYERAQHFAFDSLENIEK